MKEILNTEWDLKAFRPDCFTKHIAQLTELENLNLLWF